MKQHMSWSKVLLLLLFLNFFALELFIAGVTVYSFSVAIAIGVMPDFTPLVTLIGAVLGQTLSYGIYIAKSKAENVKGGLVYETAMLEYNQEQEVNENDPNNEINNLGE